MANQIQSDKESLSAFLKVIDEIPRPEIKSIEVIEIMVLVNGMLARMDKWTKENLSKIKP